MNSRRAFTLVELLVVVTILVVLLALLLPSMGRAMYRAQLTVCAAEQRATARGIDAYAFDFKRFYPHRKLPAPGNSSDHVPVTLLAGADTPDSNHAPIDIRPQLKPYIQINKQLLDPFVEDVDLEFEDEARTVTAISTYAMWFGVSYKNGNLPLAGLHKLGDTWQYGWNGSRIRTYQLLLGDVDLTWNGQQNISASHPDQAGDKPRLWLVSQNDFFAPTYGIRTFQSFWIWNIAHTGRPAERGLMDTNFASVDESVQQLNGYEYQDTRYDTVPYFFDTQLPSYKLHIPGP